jgi:hypothetical protein
MKITLEQGIGNPVFASKLTREQTQELGFEYADNINYYVKSLSGKGYIILFAENILAQVKKIISA